MKISILTLVLKAYAVSAIVTRAVERPAIATSSLEY